MDTRRLQLLLLLARSESMREVAEELGIATSTVSQQIAALAQEAGTPLIEPQGRGIRLTPAGRRLAEHAVTILAAVEAARRDLNPGAEPAGLLRIAGFATAVRWTLLPIAAHLAREHPEVRLSIYEHEPAEAFALLAGDHVDLALTYDYNLAPATVAPTFEARPLWSAAWSLGVPQAEDFEPGHDSLSAFGRFRDADWIVNSRNTADEDVVRTVSSMAGFQPRIAHKVDSLDLVQDLIVAGLGVALLPTGQPTPAGVRLLPLAAPDVMLRSYAVTRRGSAHWPPLALILHLLGERVTRLASR